MHGIARYSKTVGLPGRLMLDTSEGVVELVDTGDADIVLHPRGESGLVQILRREPPEAHQDVFELQLKDFVEAAAEERQPLVDGEQALESMRLIEEL